MVGKRLIIMVIVCVFMSEPKFCQSNNPEDTIYVASWNVENLYDTIDDSTTIDEEFTPESEKEWDALKFERKIMNLASVIQFMNNRKAPDVIGFQEVENILVCKHVVYEFKDRDYIVCHRQSPDSRGIDNALLYDRKVFDIVSIIAIPVELPSGNKTRDILYVVLKRKNTEDQLHIFVNHWPSRRGGQDESQENRLIAAKTLKQHVTTILANTKNAEIIIMGDFNDEPGDSSIHRLSANGENSELINLANSKFNEGEGTYFYKQDWNMLDQIIISPAMMDKNKYDYVEKSFEIIKQDFMITKEGNYAGAPIPTFAGNKYLHGFSDHFPIGARFAYSHK